MAAPEEFRDAWEKAGDQLVAFPAAAFSGLELPPQTVTFLTTAGLPESAAPFLTFGPRHTHSPTVMGSSHQGLLEIGSDGAGNPLVIGPDGVVAVLDHERGFAPLYVNADVERLAEALLACRELIDALNEAEDRGAGSDDPDWRKARERFITVVKGGDPAALEAPAFWVQELGNLSSLIG